MQQSQLQKSLSNEKTSIDQKSTSKLTQNQSTVPQPLIQQSFNQISTLLPLIPQQPTQSLKAPQIISKNSTSASSLTAA